MTRNQSTDESIVRRVNRQVRPVISPGLLVFLIHDDRRDVANGKKVISPQSRGAHRV